MTTVTQSGHDTQGHGSRSKDSRYPVSFLQEFTKEVGEGYYEYYIATYKGHIMRFEETDNSNSFSCSCGFTKTYYRLEDDRASIAYERVNNVIRVHKEQIDSYSKEN